MGREPSTKPVRILYIGRVDSAHETLWQQLQREGTQLAFATTQKAGLERAAEIQPHLVVINAANAQFSAGRVCRALARRLPTVPRLVLLDRKVDDDLLCNECLLRPYSLRKLRGSMLKLLDSTAPHLVQAGPLELDLAAKSVVGPGGRHHLTPKQCNLLAVFMERPNQVISRRDLMDQIWETEYLGDTRTLDVHIRWLREKIETDPKHPALLVTRRGVGYVLAVPELALQEPEALGEMVEFD